jgi:hypothetical protein
MSIAAALGWVGVKSRSGWRRFDSVMMPPLGQSGGAEPRKEINFLTGIAAMTSPLSSAQQPMGHVF